ncbi:RNA 2',3'-cyclic phosphodiesterase [Aquipseudomonas alcaligenes]|uniref:RNA 2',3'-cyclic phosphodiesterase n=1 Tax=Aquipseudomonas alcaligenes TaxID=43263 RepID=A0A1N6T0X8_AQUAC|nr:RNA 2',3'-cyclic phosphodiesterase [Pseudomonas alcaligenes]SIQ47012.1 2'-5' RNA ligase [Pseudomonas alcaligenes]
MLRLFFALPCPTGVAAQIDAWRQGQHFAGKPVPTANLHITLAFLGHVPESRLQQLQRVPPRLALADLAFDLHLDCLDCWSEGLLHLSPSQPPQALLNLASALQQQLQLDERPYRPHLTLARDSRPAEIRTPPSFTWHVDQLHLYQSAGGHYLSLQRWPLGQP